MEGKNFQRRKEDFTCFNCGTKVAGNGYTDHCPHCLASLHVDIKPGDRASECGGEMVPMGAERTSSDFRIIYRCRKCGATKRVVSAKEDNMELLMMLAIA